MAIETPDENKLITTAEPATETVQVLEPVVPKKQDTTLLAKLRKKWKWLVPLTIILLAIILFAPIVPAPVPPASELRPIYGVSEGTHFNSSQALIDQAVAELGGQVRVATINGTVGLDKDGYAVYKLPSYKLATQEFSTMPLGGKGIAYTGDPSQSEVNYTKLVQFFTVNNFRKTISADGGNAHISEKTVVPFVSYAVYESKEMLCAIWRADISQISTGTQLVSIGCAEKASYEKAATSVVPFYKAYIKAGGKHDKNLVFGLPDIANGSDTYKRATLYQEDGHGSTGVDIVSAAFIGLYYQTPNSSDWTYFGEKNAKTGELTQCSAYDTAALKKAFKGFECYDKASQKNSVVQTPASPAV